MNVPIHIWCLDSKKFSLVNFFLSRLEQESYSDFPGSQYPSSTAALPVASLASVKPAASAKLQEMRWRSGEAIWLSRSALLNTRSGYPSGKLETLPPSKGPDSSRQSMIQSPRQQFEFKVSAHIFDTNWLLVGSLGSWDYPSSFTRIPLRNINKIVSSDSWELIRLVAREVCASWNTGGNQKRKEW